MKLNKKFLYFLGVLIPFSAFLHFGTDKFPDPDVFYHFRHADLYWQNGITSSDFLRLPYSVISKFSADIWYGFHLFLIPFTWFKNEILGLHAAGAVITVIALLIFYSAVLRARISYAIFWPFFLVFSSPYVLYRFTMARPHVFSIALSSLFFVFVLQGVFWGVFLTAFAISFLHLALFWAPIFIFTIVSAARFLSEKKIDWRSAAALFLGLFIGWILRPNPLGALKIAYAQIIDLTLLKQKGIPLNFAMELFPMPMRDFAVFLPFIFLWVLCGFVFFRNFRTERNNFLWSSLALSILFFLMTLFIAQRSFDFWTIFGTLFIALTFSHFLTKEVRYKYIGLALFIIMAVYGFYGHAEFINQFGWNPRRFQPASEWVKNNSKDNEIVFNVAWEYFPELFFWNTKNRYISGMDPVFQYVYDPNLYWESYYLETGKTTNFTCASTFCKANDLKDTYDVLKNDFQASFVALSRPADEKLYHYLLGDARFSLGYEDDASAVFSIK